MKARIRFRNFVCEVEKTFRYRFKIRIRNFLSLKKTALLFCFWLFSATVISQQRAVTDWSRHEVKGIQYEIALEPMGKKGKYHGIHRVVYVYLDASYFSNENALAVFRDISTKIAYPILSVTLLTDRDLLKKRMNKYPRIETGNDTNYTKLLENEERGYSCPKDFKGAQFDSYFQSESFLFCANGRSEELQNEFEINELREVNKIPYRIGLFVSRRKGIIIFSKEREGLYTTLEIYVYLDSKHFNKKNVLTVLRDIYSEIAQPATIHLTLLTDRNLYKERIKRFSLLEFPVGSIYVRLTGNTSNSCPKGFKGAQLDLYPNRKNFLLCDNGQSEESIK
jgi:hypothetical protein